MIQKEVPDSPINKLPWTGWPLPLKPELLTFIEHPSLEFFVVWHAKINDLLNLDS